MKENKKFFIVVTIIAAFFLMGMAFRCDHNETYAFVVKEATCTEVGQENIVCANCDTVLESRVLDILEHSYGKFEVIIEPSTNKNGVMARVCSVCQKEETKAYFCPHEETSAFVVVEPTCSAAGREVSICKTCSSTVDVQELSPLECSFDEWNYSKYATPFESGERYHHCSVCNRVESEIYTMKLEENSIYIPGTQINHPITFGLLTQGFVDMYDIVYVENPCGKGIDNPFVLGHNYGHLGNLYKTEVGQFIYVNTNGVIETYEVVVSEFAMLATGGATIVGQETGSSVWANLGCKTLHMYTCYGGKGGRWLVLAKLVSSTATESAC